MKTVPLNSEMPIALTPQDLARSLQALKEKHFKDAANAVETYDPKSDRIELLIDQAKCESLRLKEGVQELHRILCLEKAALNGANFGADLLQSAQGFLVKSENHNFVPASSDEYRAQIQISRQAIRDGYSSLQTQISEQKSGVMHSITTTNGVFSDESVEIYSSFENEGTLLSRWVDRNGGAGTPGTVRPRPSINVQNAGGIQVSHADFPEIGSVYSGTPLQFDGDTGVAVAREYLKRHELKQAAERANWHLGGLRIRDIGAQIEEDEVAVELRREASVAGEQIGWINSLLNECNRRNEMRDAIQLEVRNRLETIVSKMAAGAKRLFSISLRLSYAFGQSDSGLIVAVFDLGRFVDQLGTLIPGALLEYEQGLEQLVSGWRELLSGSVLQWRQFGATLDLAKSKGIVSPSLRRSFALSVAAFSTESSMQGKSIELRCSYFRIKLKRGVDGFAQGVEETKVQVVVPLTVASSASEAATVFAAQGGFPENLTKSMTLKKSSTGSVVLLVRGFFSSEATTVAA